jgi:cytoskeletal protein CcmA (bactofilin family)
MAKIDFNNIQTMIGAGAVVNGPITLKGGIIIYGKVYGDIQTDGPLRITVSGQVFGNVQAIDAHIGGSIKGDITVTNKIVLGSKSEITGDLIYRSLIIEDGAQFEGSCSVIGNKENVGDSSVKKDLKSRFTIASSPSDPNA